MWPSSFATPQFQTGESHAKISRLTWNYIHLTTLGLESLQNQPGLANKKMGTGLRKSHSCRDHMSIHCPPDHTVWRCYLASLAVLDILPFSSYTYSRSIRHPYGIFWNPMAHVLLLEKKQELAGLCRVGHWRTLRLALLHLHQPSLTNVASKGLELHG